MVSSRTAPATTRSARRGSRPGIVSRCSRSVSHDFFPHAADLLRRHPQVAKLRRLGTARRGRGDDAEAEDGARRADDAIEADRGDLLAVPIDFIEHVLGEPALVALRERVALDEAFGQPDDADLEAARQLDRGAGAKRDLHAAAADVDDHRAAAADVDAVHGGLVDEPRFFGAGDDHGTDAGFALDAREELAAVAGLAGGAGRHGENLVDAVGIGEPLEGRQRLERCRHRLGRERAAVETAGAEPDHGLLAVDDLEREIRTHAHDDHVNRVGPDIDRGDAHGKISVRAYRIRCRQSRILLNSSSASD